MGDAFEIMQAILDSDFNINVFPKKELEEQLEKVKKRRLILLKRRR